jgi:hypothetical protein
MKRTSCPYLGLKEDATTALNFPSEGNHCHHTRPVAPINPAHQQQRCLTAEYGLCPIYQAAHPGPMPAALAAPGYLLNQKKRQKAIIAIPLMIIALLLLSLGSSVIASRMNFRSLFVPPTGDNAQALIPGQYGFQLLVPSSTATPNQMVTTTPVLEIDCPPPEGWVTYIVNPTDSLFRLSVVFSVSVNDLQFANCMGANTVILPGQKLSVPFIPTRTPSLSPTARIFPSSTYTAIPQPRVIQPSSTPVPPQEEQPQPPTNTAVPPTDTLAPPPPDTPVPPSTSTPVPPEPTKEPPSEKPKPTKKPKGNDDSTDLAPTNTSGSDSSSSPPRGNDDDDDDDNKGKDKNNKDKDNKDKDNKGKGKKDD